MTYFIIAAVVLIIVGIIRYSRGHKSEGIFELVAGIFEILFEVLAAFL